MGFCACCGWGAAGFRFILNCVLEIISFFPDSVRSASYFFYFVRSVVLFLASFSFFNYFVISFVSYFIDHSWFYTLFRFSFFIIRPCRVRLYYYHSFYFVLIYILLFLMMSFRLLCLFSLFVWSDWLDLPDCIIMAEPAQSFAAECRGQVHHIWGSLFHSFFSFFSFFFIHIFDNRW